MTKFERILKLKKNNFEIDPNPCWEGYEQIGTKIIDGREVPNCVPIKAAMKKSFAEGDSLENVCWDGYEPVGMKEVDGRMVPNCVPIKDK